jgi:hypothetical protein
VVAGVPPALGELIFSQPARLPLQFPVREIRLIHGRLPDFRRNEPANSAEYLTERPEMTSHGGKPWKAKTMKENNNYEDDIKKQNCTGRIGPCRGFATNPKG